MRSFFSGIGPTRDGRVKPDIAAPGEWMGSSLSSGKQPPPDNSIVERDGAHWIIRGTSMSTPHVAGAAAVMLGINPDLDGAHIKNAMMRTARTDEFTGAVPNVFLGHGKLDVLMAGLEAAVIVTDLTATSGGGLTGLGTGGSSGTLKLLSFLLGMTSSLLFSGWS